MFQRGTTLFSFAAAAFLVAPAAAQDTPSVLDRVEERGVLVAGIRQDNPPHSFIDNEGNWVGFDVDIAQAIAEEMDVTLERVPVDEITRISYLKNDTIDIAVASMSHTWKRDAQIDFSQTYFWAGQTFLVRDGEVGKLADLIGKPVGMSRGSHSIANWRAWVADSGAEVIDQDIVEFGDKQVAVNAVLSGKIAGWAEDHTVLVNYAKANPELIVLTDESIGMKQDGIGLKENDSPMRDAINRALQGIEVWPDG
jgi:polar amino acid transport system substrate-binding protein